MPQLQRRLRFPHLVFVASLASASIAHGAPPSVQFLVAPPAGDSSHYAQVIAWRGTDPEGSPLTYRYAVDQEFAPSPIWFDTDWTSALFLFRTPSLVEPLPAEGPPLFAGSHHFAVKAVDGEALESAPAAIGFYSTNRGPEVRLTSPVPDPAAPVDILSAGFTLSWSGVDWDGLFSNRPVQYKYRVWTQHAFEYPQYPNFIDFVRNNPEQFRQLVAPTFANWDSCPGETTSVRYTNFVPGQEYLFTLTAFDEAGAYAARFTNATNLFWFRISPSVGVGPTSATARLRLGPAAPNPADGAVALSLESPATTAARIEVVDVGGRQVRTLYEGSLAGGRHPVTWDLTDASGHRVAAGVYFVRALTPGGAGVRRFVVLP